MRKNDTKNLEKPVIYRIEAKKKPIGRVASEIAKAIQGKLLPDYSPEKLPPVLVVVQNASKLIITGKKIKEKKYYRYTGYPGGIKVRRMEEIFKSNPENLLLNIVKKMLPDNKLRPKMLKRIKFKNKNNG